MTEQSAEKYATADNMIDLDHYPIKSINDEPGKHFAARCRQNFHNSGLCALPGFIKPNAMSALVKEAESMREDAYFCKSLHNAYLTDEMTSDASDAVRTLEHTFVGSVPYDRIPTESSLNQLYLWDPLMKFIGHVLGKDTFHRLADPLGACTINVFVDGGEHGWHFDEAEFTVTLMLQKPDEGGAFEYVPGVRDLPDEKLIVEQVLAGERDLVKELPFTTGTLLIFGGRQTLHRVTRVSGKRARLLPVLCYSEHPDVVNSESVRQLFWGRTGPEVPMPAQHTSRF
ncbi:MAG: hypothetical protein KTR32_25635 [Granulosicoccus sp.]|nr:hypothetical protein [Granulosicoccus sp.]